MKSDSPWKEILEKYFKEFMDFFFFDAWREIDWRQGHEFLDKEFQKLAKDAKLGKRLADKLVKVWLKTGEEVWILIHIEIQGKAEEGFAKRIITGFSTGMTAPSPALPFLPMKQKTGSRLHSNIKSSAAGWA